MTHRAFLFLQGPHGPFFGQLADRLRRSGVSVLRVGFNAGDAAFWGRRPGYIPYRGDLADWPMTLAKLLKRHRITDIVLYGDTRPVHAAALWQAKSAGLRAHVFEEGYLRPFWVTYERGGSNGHSRLMRLSLSQMRAQITRSDGFGAPPPAHWGDMRQHIFYGAAYHWFVMFRNRRYPGFRPHRALPVHREAALYTKRLLLMPFLALQRSWHTWWIKTRSQPYHIALLQLEHDASFQAHSPFEDITSFIKVVISGFAAGAPADHHLVFKAHPLDNGGTPLPRVIAQIAEDHGIAQRVHHLRGGKLAQLLDHAQSAVTVNSTAGQQVLWRGLPLKIFGTAVYDKPAFVSDQPLPAFYANPRKPDVQAYRDYRQFLLQTSQIPGGFYAAAGRKQLLHHVVGKMLDARDPYDIRQTPCDSAVPRMRVVKGRMLA